ncbi:MAG: PRTRC system protein A [Geobacter sp.]|nr:MAG: PRTRC system protein A [Geobacter sp.]
MTTHPLDIALQTACPTVMVPQYGELAPLDRSGHRFLSACDGLWVEIRRPWLHMIWPVATQTAFPNPYGTVEKKVELAFGKIPTDLIARFAADAREAFPNECGAWLIWDDQKKQLRYHAMPSLVANGSYLEAQRPDLEEHESLAVNLHSHGRHFAGFSSTDNRDDRNEVKIAGVIGSLHTDSPTAAFRICTGGEFINLDVEKLLPALG